MARLPTRKCPKCNEPLHRIYTRVSGLCGTKEQYHHFPIGYICFHCSDKDEERNKLPSIYEYESSEITHRKNLIREMRKDKSG
jgi:predicted nucleic acid-binding Zn ribbon protein